MIDVVWLCHTRKQLFLSAFSGFSLRLAFFLFVTVVLASSSAQRSTAPWFSSILCFLFAWEFSWQTRQTTIYTWYDITSSAIYCVIYHLENQVAKYGRDVFSLFAVFQFFSFAAWSWCCVVVVYAHFLSSFSFCCIK